MSRFAHFMYFKARYVIGKVFLFICVKVEANISIIYQVRITPLVILLKRILTETNCNVSHERNLLPVIELISARIFLDLSALFNTIGQSFLEWKVI